MGPRCRRFESGYPNFGEDSSVGRAGINESCIRFLQQCFSWTCNPRVVGSNPTPRHWLCLAIQGSLCVHGADNLHKKYRHQPRKLAKWKGTSIKKVKSDSKGAAGISWLRQSRKMKTSRISGYEIQYWEKGKKNKQYKTVKGYKKVSATIKTMRSGKTYCFRVRTYMKQFGRRYYSSWSPGKNVKVK